MTKRRLLWVVSVACLTLAVCLAAWLFSTRSGQIRLANHRNIRNGMTLTEVERLLGSPPGNYSSDPGQPVLSFSIFAGRHSKTWVTDEMQVEIYFDDDWRVAGRSYSGPPVKPSWLVRLRDRLGW